MSSNFVALFEIYYLKLKLKFCILCFLVGRLNWSVYNRSGTNRPIWTWSVAIYMIYIRLFTFWPAEVILTAVDVLFVAYVILQLKSGLYSKSMVYTANPTRGILSNYVWNKKLWVDPNCPN